MKFFADSESENIAESLVSEGLVEVRQITGKNTE